MLSVVQGVVEFSEPIGLDDNFHIDLIVVGCVAVSPTGWLLQLQYKFKCRLGLYL